MITQCTGKRTVWRTMPKDGNEPVPWKCKACGANLGHVSKDTRGWHYLTPADKPEIHCYGDAEITCQFCGAVRKWYWSAFVIKKVLRGRLQHR